MRVECIEKEREKKIEKKVTSFRNLIHIDFSCNSRNLLGGFKYVLLVFGLSFCLASCCMHSLLSGQKFDAENPPGT